MFTVKTVKIALSAGIAALIMSSAVAQSAKPPVKIGMLMPTKAWTGQQAVKGAEIAAQLINAKGGILGGRKVQVVVYDDNSSPVDGAAAAQRMIDQDKIKVFGGQFSSSVAMAIVPIAKAERVLYMSTLTKGTAVVKSGYPGVFRLNTMAEQDSGAMKQLFRAANPQSVAYIGENTDFGRQFLDVIKGLLADTSKGKLATSGFYNVKQADFNALVTDAKASGADTLIVMGGIVEQYANVVRAATDLGYKPKNIILGPGILNKGAVDLAGKSLEGASSVDIYLPTFDNPVNKEFVSAYLRANKAQPEKIEALGFETVWLLAKAMDKAGTADDVQKISTTLRANTWLTPRGNIKFDAEGQAQGEAVVMKVQSGNITQVK